MTSRARRVLDLAAWNALKGASWPLFERVGELARAAGTTPPQISLLHILNSGAGPMTPLAVAHELGVTAGTVTATLDKLEARGLLQRSRGQQRDGRVVTLRISAKGRALVTRWHEACRREFTDAFAALSDDDLRVLVALLAKVAPSIEGVPRGLAARRR